MERTPPDVTTLLAEIRGGSPAERQAAGENLFRLVESELHRLAEAHLFREGQADPLLQPTLLLDEAFRKLVGGPKVGPENRTQFFGFAARAMRQILVDHARRRQARGDGRQVSLDGTMDFPVPERSLDLVALDEALARLAELDPRSSQIVELRFFGGLTEGEIAEEMGISVSTVKRDWEFARDWLYEEIHRDSHDSGTFPAIQVGGTGSSKPAGSGAHRLSRPGLCRRSGAAGSGRGVLDS